MPVTPSPSSLQQAKISTYIVFIAAGFALSTWASRIPQIKDALGLNSADWGLVLLAMAAGSVSALPATGAIINWIGPKGTVRIFSVVASLALAAVGLGYLVGVWPVVIALFLFGFGAGAWDVSMNVEGALVEHHLRRAIMPRFHAGFSVGTVGGALLGAIMLLLKVNVAVHLVVVALLIGAVVAVKVGGFLPEQLEAAVTAKAELDDFAESPQGAVEAESLQSAAGTETPPAKAKKFSVLQAVKEPRTLLIGLFVLTFSFAEGTAIDWIGVALIDEYGTSASAASFGLAIFLTTMTLTRWFGSALLDRFGRVGVLRMLAVFAFFGVLLFVFSPTASIAFVGAALWGAGASLGFPVGMSAGGDDPAKSAARVSVIASIGYVAFLAGPPLIGLLAEQFTILYAILAVAVLMPVAIGIVGVLKSPSPVADVLEQQELKEKK